MKIGIITFWWSSDNYGQLLQAYALSKYLKNTGYSPLIIKYQPIGNTFKKRINRLYNRGWKKLSLKKVIYLLRLLKNHTTNQEFEIAQNDRKESFNDFRNKYLTFTKENYYTLKDLKSGYFKFDAFICGSDKIWSSVSNKMKFFDQLDVFSLAFTGDRIKKLAYAPSIGCRSINPKSIKHLALNIHDFNGISVREESSIGLLNNCNLSNVQWVPDPTQLIGPEGYYRFIDSDPTKYQKNWFIYGLNNPSYITSNQIANELLIKGVEFAYTGANRNTDDLINCYPTIPEWLSYMYYAKNIITNSYHGCIFCILFHKNFYYVPVLPDKNGLPDERVLSIMNRYEIKDRAIKSLEELQQVITNPYKPIDWESVDAKREEFVQVGKDFLAKHLGDATT